MITTTNGTFVQNHSIAMKLGYEVLEIRRLGAAWYERIIRTRGIEVPRYLN